MPHPQWAGTRSTYHAMPEGLPQGSQSGPCLFAHFSSDLEVDLMYCDDAAIAVDGASAKECISKMNEKLLGVGRWCRRWRLPIRRGVH